MGAIQQAINTTIGIISGIKKMQQFEEEKMQQANIRAQNQKVLKLKQKALSEKYRAEFAKSKLEKTKYKQQYSELKQSDTPIFIGGTKINSPQLLSKIKEGINDRK